jgi:GT2 family glycosyltransferase
MFNIALMCSCHNRARLTKRSLNSITNTLKNTRLVDKFHFFVLDDCSVDETYIFLKNFKNTSVVKSDKNLYWAGGMNFCFNYFNKELIEYDLFIPFNDDIELDVKNLDRLLDRYQELLEDKKEFILSVPCYYQDKITYSGSKFKIHSSIPLFKRVEPIKNTIIKVDVVNMNFLLIPMTVIKKYNFLDNYFTHSLADFAYSLKLKKHGIYSYLYDLPSVICEPNLTGRKKLKGINKLPQKKFYQEYFRFYYYFWPIRIVSRLIKFIFLKLSNKTN